MVFGWKGLPVYDLARAHYALGVGADFLGGWASPVYYARQFGAFRQGRRNIRGQLVQAESRLSITAAAADRWLPLRPGTEAQFLAAAGRMLLDAGLARNREALPKSVAGAFQAADAAALLAICGLEEKKVRQIVQELGESEAPLVLAGASVIHTNSLDAIAASHYINLMLGVAGKPGGILAPGAAAAPPDRRNLVEALGSARVVLIDGANPVYTMPRSAGVADALARAELVIAFGPFLDDSAAWSDLLLPDHHPLESEMAIVPAVSVQPAVAVGTPFVAPLYGTRAVETTLADLAHKIGVEYQPAAPKDIVEPLLTGGMSYEDAARQGGIWQDPPAPAPPRPNAVALDLSPARFEGDPAQYPFHFQPYPSLQFQDGRGANLPWLQELPDPAVELHLGIAGRDRSQDRREVAVGERRHGPRGVSARVARSACVCSPGRGPGGGEHGDRRRTFTLFPLRFRPRSQPAFDPRAGVGQGDGRPRAGGYAGPPGTGRRSARVDAVFDRRPAGTKARSQVR